MSPFVGNNILAGAAGQGGAAGYRIDRSLRFNDSDSAALDRVFLSEGSRTTWTFSAWVKRSDLGRNGQALFDCRGTSNNNDYLEIRFAPSSSPDSLTLSTALSNYRVSNAVFRDTSAWFHVVWACNTNAAQQSDRIKLYVNGVQQTFQSQAGISQGMTLGVNQALNHRIGRNFDGYLADVHFIDGQALDPTDFGEYDDNNVWQPKEFTGNYGIVSVADATGALPIYNTTDTYGTIKGTGTRTDSSSSSIVLALPMDGANNGTIFTDESATIKGSGTAQTITVNGNTKTSTSQSIFYGSSAVFDGTDDNLKLPASADFQFGSGDFTIETWFRPNNTNRMAIYHGSSGVDWSLGIDYSYITQTIGIWASSNGTQWDLADGDSSGNRGSIVVPANSWSHIAFVRNGSSLQLYINGVLDKQFSTTSSIADRSSYQPVIGEWWNGVYDLNGYLADFRIYKGVAKYTSNFNPIDSYSNSFKLDFSDNSSKAALGYDASVEAPTVNPDGGFDVVTYTGNSSGQSISSLAFQPDFVWIKNRDDTDEHMLFNVISGPLYRLNSSNANSEASQSNTLTAFVSNGFTLGSDGQVNQSSQNYVAWCWKAGGTPSSNTDGTITSQVSASTDYGFSVVSFTGNGTGGATIGHSLGQAPKWIVIKSRNRADNWRVYHSGTGETKALFLSTAGAADTSSAYFNNTAPTNSVFSVGTDSGVNTSGDPLIAYCWSEVPGFSKFGSYTANGSDDGPQVTTGFPVAYLLTKRVNSTGSWEIHDLRRPGTNPQDDRLLADSNTTEASGNDVDFLTDGFKIKNSLSGMNGANGDTYVYAAFAHRPGNNWDVNNLVAAAGTSNPAPPSYTITGSGTFENSPSRLFDNALGLFTTANWSALVAVQFSIPFTTSLRCYITTHADMNRNGGTVFRFTGGSGNTSPPVQTFTGWYDFTSIGSPFTKIEWNRTTNSFGAFGVSAIEVDGTIIYDIAGKEIDSLLDTPTNYDDGTNVGGNYATWNPLQKYSAITLANGNLDFSDSNSANGGDRGVHATIAPTSGKFYWEMTLSQLASENYIGISKSDKLTQTVWTGGAVDGYYYHSNGNKIGGGNGNGGVSYGASIAVGDVVGVAVDWDNGKVTFYKNGVSQGDAFTGKDLTGYIPAFYFNTNQSAAGSINFGQRPFAYPVSGYKSLCTTNLPDPTIADGSTAFDAALWTGNGSSQSITGIGFSPDLIWIKNRSVSDTHAILDTIRGANNVLSSNHAAGNRYEGGSVSAFNSDGFTVGSYQDTNRNSSAFVGWTWDGGDLATTSDTTNYNQSQTWSSFGGSGVYSSTYDWTKLFDGDSTNRTIPANGSSITVDFSSLSGGGISYTSSVEVTFKRNTNGPDVTVNGSAIGATANYVETTYTLSGSGTLTSVGTLTRNAAGGGNTDLMKIVVDGKELIDPGVIPVGSLNSSAYDQSYVWSNFVSGTAYSGYPITNAFNGDLSTRSLESGSTGHTFTPPSPITVTSSLRIYIAYGDASATNVLKVNGTDYSSLITSTGNIGWITIPNISSVTSIFYGVSPGGIEDSSVSAIEVDGKILVDSGVSVINFPTIASTVRANPSAGFSICTWSGTGSAGTIGHGLNAPLQMIVIKQRTNHGTTGQGDGNWIVGHTGVTMGTGRLILNGTYSNDVSGAAAHWSSTAATSSVFSVGTSGNVNGSNGAQYIAYCFAPVEGYSAFGSYEGNGNADGPFVYTGFSIKFLLLKSADTSYDWFIYDFERDTANPLGKDLRANSSAVEADSVRIDLLSNGFKLRTSSAANNSSNNTWIYAAFADYPFKTARAR